VLRLLVLSVRWMGWDMELWTQGELRPEHRVFLSHTRRGAQARASTKADVLWSPHPEFFESPLRAVATVHDINPLLPDGRSPAARWLRAVRFRAQTRRTFQRAWRVVTDSRDARVRIARAFPGLARTLRVVSLFVDPELKPPGRAQRDAALQALGLSPGYIL